MYLLVRDRDRGNCESENARSLMESLGAEFIKSVMNHTTRKGRKFHESGSGQAARDT